MFMSVHIDHSTHVENVEFRGWGWCLSSPSTLWDRPLCFATVYTRKADLLGILLFCLWFHDGSMGIAESAVAPGFACTWSVWAGSGKACVCVPLSPELFTSCSAHFWVKARGWVGRRLGNAPTPTPIGNGEICLYHSYRLNKRSLEVSEGKFSKHHVPRKLLCSGEAQISRGVEGLLQPCHCPDQFHLETLF